jgi:hypothetical protein
MSVPNRIQRLLKSLLSETADKPMANRGRHDADAEKLEAAGFDVDALMTANWSADDAVTFAIDARYHVIMWIANNSEDRAYQHSDFGDFFTGGYRDANVNKGVVGMDWAKYRTLAQWHKDFFSLGERANSKMMMGRLWRKTNFVSFWNKKDDVMREWNLILDFITNMKLNPKKCAYEFIDRMDIELYDEVGGKPGAKSKEIDPEVLRQMHTSPELKKAILGTDTGKKRSAMDGYYSHIGDNVIKLGDLLKEDPDDLAERPQPEAIRSRMIKLGVDVNRINKSLAGYDFPDAVPFVFDRRHSVLFFSYLSVGDNHSRITHEDLFDNIAIYLDNPHLYKLSEMPYGWTITPVETDAWDDVSGPGVTPGPVSFLKMPEQKVKYYIENDAQVLGAPSRNNPKFIQGRMWTKIPAVSFWAKKEKAVQPTIIGSVFDLLKSMKVDPQKTMYEFIDHPNFFFSDELDVPVVDTMSREEMLAKMAKQHLDPNVKRDLNKGVEQPDKFGGMLPVAYHDAQRTSDGIIKLGDLLK